MKIKLLRDRQGNVKSLVFPVEEIKHLRDSLRKESELYLFLEDLNKKETGVTSRDEVK